MKSEAKNVTATAQRSLVEVQNQQRMCLVRLTGLILQLRLLFPFSIIHGLYSFFSVEIFAHVTHKLRTETGSTFLFKSSRIAQKKPQSKRA